MFKDIIFRFRNNLKLKSQKRGFSTFGAVFIAGFITGIISAAFSSYYYYVFSASSSEPIVVSEQDEAESKYLESLQIGVTATVPEFLGVRYFSASNGTRYLIIFGNTPSGFVVLDKQGIIISEFDGIPGDGFLIELGKANENLTINVKY